MTKTQLSNPNQTVFSSSRAPQRSGFTQLRLDSHCHFYPAYDPKLFLKSLSCNLLAPRPDSSSRELGVLAAVVLTEGYRDRAGYQRLLEWCLSNLANTEQFSDHFVVYLYGAPIAIYPGRQLITREGLELLVLCCSVQFEEQYCLSAWIRRLLGEGELVVLPWSPGKWSGARLTALRGVMEQPEWSQIILGDQPLRCSPSWQASYFRSAGRRVLCGSDPLADPKEACQGGRLYSCFTLPPQSSEDGSSWCAAPGGRQLVTYLTKQLEKGSFDAPPAEGGARDSLWSAANRWLRSTLRTKF